MLDCTRYSFLECMAPGKGEEQVHKADNMINNNDNVQCSLS